MSHEELIVSFQKGDFERFISQVYEVKDKESIPLSIFTLLGTSTNVDFVEKFVLHVSKKEYAEEILKEAIKVDNLQMVKFLYESTLLTEDEHFRRSDLFGFGLDHGSVQSIKFLHGKGHCWGIFNPFWRAAKGGNLECLKFVFQHRDISQAQQHSVLDMFARHGHFECIKFLLEKNVEVSAMAVRNTAKYGHLDCLELLYDLVHEKQLHISFNDVAITAAAHGQLAVLEFLHKKNCIFSERVCTQAAAGGHLACLQFLHERNHAWSSSTVNYACQNGQFECLKYALDHGCLFIYESKAAVKAGNLECLKLIVEVAKPDSEAINLSLLHAAKLGHFELVKYLHQKGGEWSVEIVEEMAKLKNIDCLRYALENHAPGLVSGYEIALETGNIDFVMYFYDKYEKQIDLSLRSSSRRCQKMFEYDVDLSCRDKISIKWIANLDCLKFLHSKKRFSLSLTLFMFCFIHEKVDCFEYMCEFLDTFEDPVSDLCEAMLQSLNDNPPSLMRSIFQKGFHLDEYDRMQNYSFALYRACILGFVYKVSCLKFWLQRVSKETCSRFWIELMNLDIATKHICCVLFDILDFDQHSVRNVLLNQDLSAFPCLVSYVEQQKERIIKLKKTCMDELYTNVDTPLMCKYVLENILFPYL
jgi:hypothetical protein